MDRLKTNYSRSGMGTLFYLLALSLSPAMSAELTGRVVAVADGDTITVLSNSQEQIKIRLAGIDAPERGQPYGSESKRALSQLVFNKLVTVEWSKRDQYGRVIGRVLVRDQDACLEQVRTGMAWHYKKYAREQTPLLGKLYAEAELDARKHAIGLWMADDPMPPWDRRKKKRRAIPNY